MPYTPHIHTLAMLAAMLFGLTGCSEEVNPVLGTNRPYTLYGVLSPELDRQSVIVFPTEGTLKPRLPIPLDAVFTTTDLTTGEKATWTDSVTVDEHGLYEHVFCSQFSPMYGHTYRVEAKRSDGALSYAEAAVPPQVTLRALESSDIICPVLVEGAPHVLRVTVTYGVSYDNGAGGIEDARVELPFEGKQRSTPAGTQIPINLAKDREPIIDEILSESGGSVKRDRIMVRGIEVKMIIAAEAWNPPGGQFDPEVLADPAVMSNVQNGFGIVTAGFHRFVNFLPSERSLQVAGFTTDL